MEFLKVPSGISGSLKARRSYREIVSGTPEGGTQTENPGGTPREILSRSPGETSRGIHRETPCGNPRVELQE